MIWMSYSPTGTNKKIQLRSQNGKRLKKKAQLFIAPWPRWQNWPSWTTSTSLKSLQTLRTTKNHDYPRNSCLAHRSLSNEQYGDHWVPETLSHKNKHAQTPALLVQHLVSCRERKATAAKVLKSFVVGEGRVWREMDISMDSEDFWGGFIEKTQQTTNKHTQTHFLKDSKSKVWQGPKLNLQRQKNYIYYSTLMSSSILA